LTYPSKALYFAYKELNTQIMDHINKFSIRKESFKIMAEKVQVNISWVTMFCSREHVDLYLPSLVLDFLRQRLIQYVKKLTKDCNRNQKLKFSKRKLKIESTLLIS